MLRGMKITRHIDLPQLLRQKSFFLFGPRATGKSTCVAQQLAGQAEVIDLLDSDTLFKFSNDFKQLEAAVTASQHRIVVIDEIQKLPQLLNDVHRLIERQGTHFLLTGSSTRKLRRGGVNLLAGRAWEAQLFPLSYHELPQFDLERYLYCGGLPAVYLSTTPAEELRAYVSTYMRQEIQEEALVRRLPSFTRFLQAMALSNGEILNYAKIANDCQTAPSTVASYVQILADTLLAGQHSPRGRQPRNAKPCALPSFIFLTRELLVSSQVYVAWNAMQVSMARVLNISSGWSCVLGFPTRGVKRS